VISLRFSSLKLGARYIFLNMIWVIDNRRGHSKKLYKRQSRLDIKKFVFGNRLTDKWNNLPQCCINYTTLNNFKSHIHKVLKPETR